MKKVNLELTKEQYKELLKLVYLGDWVIDEPENMVLNELVQTIFAQSKEIGLGKLMEHNKEMDLFMPSGDFEDEVVDIVEDYEEDSFWDHLIYRLAERDLHVKLGKEADAMSMEAKIDMLDPLTEKYVKEFEAKGLENLMIKSSHLKKV